MLYRLIVSYLEKSLLCIFFNSLTSCSWSPFKITLYLTSPLISLTIILKSPDSSDSLITSSVVLLAFEEISLTKLLSSVNINLLFVVSNLILNAKSLLVLYTLISLSLTLASTFILTVFSVPLPQESYTV